MELPACWHCAHAFRYRELVWNWRLRCPACGKKQYLTKDSRFQTLLLGMPVYLIAVPVITIFELPLYIGLPAIFILAVMMLFIFPFWYRFTDEEQPFV